VARRWNPFGRSTPELPDDWEDVIARRFPAWWELPVEDRTAARDVVLDLLGRVRWEAARGFELTDEVRLVVASQAARLVLRMPPPWFPNLGSIIVHADHLVSEGERPGPVDGVWEDDDLVLSGEAGHGHGPVVLVWPDVLWELRHPRRGRNVAIHEFAHKLDMLDDVVDGTPPLLDPDLRERWIEVCTATYEQLDADGSPVLDDYGAEDPGEFFAVATEALFTRSAALLEHHPDLHELLVAYFGYDPAAP
jgi:MtfA peptidase